MATEASFRYGNDVDYAKLSKLLIQAKQISSDVTDIIPVYKDPELIDTVKILTPFFEELGKTPAPESTYRWEKQSANNFGKFVAESNAATRFAAQKGTYAESTVTTRLLSYILNVGMLAQKNVQPYLDLARKEQEIGMLAMRKAIERCVITGAPAAGSDGGITDALAFTGLGVGITTNYDTPTPAEAISLDKIDAMMDKLNAYGVPDNEILIVTDPYTATNVSGLFYNTFNTPIDKGMTKAGVKVTHYRDAPIFKSSYMPTTTGSREMYFVHKRSTVLAEFYPMSQIDLGRTQLSDDSVMFWMGALAIKDEPANGKITKIV